MFRALLNFEIEYQFKQKAFFGFSLIFLAFGAMVGSTGFAPAKVAFNSAYQISYNIALLSLGSVFAIMFFAISGILRDKQYGMESIVHCTSIKKSSYFFSRFTGVLLFSILAFSMTLIGFALGTLSPSLDSERLHAFQIAPYLWAWGVIVLPNLFICTSIIFAVSALSKNNIATYGSAIIIYSLYWLCSIFFNSPLLASSSPPDPDHLIIATLADPFGLSAFFEQTQYWTSFQKNKQFIALSDYFLWNRIMWISISASILACTYHFFSFKVANQKVKKVPPFEVVESSNKTYQAVSKRSVPSNGQWARFYALIKLELVQLFKGLPFLAILLVWLVIVFTEIYARIYQGGAYNDSLYPTTNHLIGLIKDPLPFFSLLLIVFYSGEIIWRKHSLKFHEIIDAAPTSNAVFFFSKTVILLLLPAILMGFSILIAIGFQLAKGYYNFELEQYISMFYFLGFPFLFYTLLAVFIQNLSPNKYIGMGITGLIIILFGSPIAGMIGIEHPLLRLGRMPRVDYNNMNGYGNAANAFHYYAVLWGALGGILAILSFQLWQRGSIRTFKGKLKQAAINWLPKQYIMLFVFGIIFLTAGMTIYYTTNIINDYITTNSYLDFLKNYERKYKKYDSPRQLIPIQIKNEVAIFPDQNKYSVQAEYLLENRGTKEVNTLFVSEKIPVSSMQIENAVLLERDTIYNVRIFNFNEPVAPGECIKYTYTLHYEKKRFENNSAIVRNGSFIQRSDFDPILGYRSSLEITDTYERKKRGLPKRLEEKADASHLEADAAYIKLPFETIVSTQSGQTAIASGTLLDSWEKDNRTYFHYKSSIPVIPFIAYYSGKYTIKKEQYQDITIEQYIHPGHAYNSATITKQVKQTLAYCSQYFGNYPFDHIRIVEIPGHWYFGGQAQPGTIAMVEDRLYLVDNRDPESFDLVAKRTIHEVAHQWWGHILTPKNGDGAGLITEGLAKYTEAVVMEQAFGQRALWQLSENANRRYFSGRSFENDSESPLFLEEGQSYLLYGKSYISLLALKELIGVEKMNQAINSVVQRHQHDIEPQVGAMHLLEAFYQVTPVFYHHLVDDWFKRIIRYDLKLQAASVKALQNGQFEITVDISAKRFETLENGEEVAVSIQEPIPIGVFSTHPRQVDTANTILYLDTLEINQEQQQLKLIIDQYPTYISIDPFGTRPDKNRVNNTKQF